MDIGRPTVSEPWIEVFKSAVEQSFDSVLITDADLSRSGPYIIYANPAFERMTGYGRRDILGQNPKFLQGCETDPAVIDRLRANITAGQPFHGRALNYRKDGTAFLMEWTISPIHNEQGRITHFIAVQRDVTESQRMIDMLRHKAMIDGLTGTYNRSQIEHVLDKEIERVSRYDRNLSVIMIDIDHFKTLNDTHGHATGDAVLKAFAERISKQLRSTDAVGRWGGEEFLVVLPETDAAAACILANSLCKKIASAPLAEGMNVTASFGVADIRSSHDRSLLVEAADEALYAAKADGRNTVRTAKLLTSCE